MTVNEFLKKLLKSQALTQQMLGDLSSHRAEVEEVLREKFGTEPTIRYGGSKAKGTMIQEGYDLDVVCYFPRDCDRDIDEIYKDVQKKLSGKYSVTPKNSALRIQKLDTDNATLDYHIDVVPGRFIDDKKQDTFLYVSHGDVKRIKTNLDTHIKVISQSGCVDIIRVGKLWRARNSINLRTFLLELLIIKCLESYNAKDNLQSSFKKFLEYLRDSISDVRLEDPANTNNVVSDNWSDGERQIISSKAEEALNIVDSDSDDPDKWREIFREPKSDKYIGESSVVITKNQLSKPWCI